MPGALSLIGFMEMECGVLGTHPGRQCEIIDAPVIFGKEIGFVLLLMKHTVVEVAVRGAVTVGLLGGPDGQTRLVPLFYIVSFECICLIAVYNAGGNISERIPCTLHLFSVFRKGMSLVI